MIAILVFANWGKSVEERGIWFHVYHYKWMLTSLFAALLGIILIVWYNLPRIQIILGSLPVIVTTLLISEEPRISFVMGAVALVVILSRRDDEAGVWLKESGDLQNSSCRYCFLAY